MLAAKPKTRRFLELVQIVLAFVSVCAVAEATRMPPRLDAGAGYHAGTSQGNEKEAMDRRLSDLARAERKRREAEQQASRRGLTLEQGHTITFT